MKEITKENLNNIESQYLNNTAHTITRRALVKSKISDLIRVNEQTEFSRDMFSINLKTLPVTDQKQSGRCWIFAGCNVIREKIAKEVREEIAELEADVSEEKIKNLKDKEKDDRTLDGLLSNGIQDGGQWDLFVNIVNKYGIVPKSAFPETFQSSNTREIDELLNRYIRKFAFEIRHNNENIDGKKAEYIENIYKILCSSFGVPPKKFSFEYVDKDDNYNIIL